MDWIYGLRAFLWCFLAVEAISVVINCLALAANLPPIKIEIGHGTRLLKVLGGLAAVVFIWHAIDFVK